MVEGVVKLCGKHNQYQWGRVGVDSLVYFIQSKQYNDNDDCGLIDCERYSELWMGTHSNGPSSISSTGKNLSDYLNESGSSFTTLPFLFKVLSIDKPLSIQAHPDKVLAEKLHRKFPDIYKDDNHKPELACALTPFEALCGFRPLEEIFQLIKKDGNELMDLLGGKNTFEDLEIKEKNGDISSDYVVRTLFSKLMKIAQEILCKEVNNMMERINSIDLSEKSEFHILLSYVNHHFPGDVGVFCLFFLNYLKLNPGDAIFLGPNLPHCYLSGNCIECMACSDNVVRAGLTPKLRDAETLCSMLNYSQEPIPIIKGNSIDEFTHIYPAPINEFILYRVFITNPISEPYCIPRPEKYCPAIILVLKGSATIVVKNTFELIESQHSIETGTILYVHPNVDLKLIQCDIPLELFYCSCKSI